MAADEAADARPLTTIDITAFDLDCSNRQLHAAPSRRWSEQQPAENDIALRQATFSERGRNTWDRKPLKRRRGWPRSIYCWCEA